MEVTLKKKYIVSFSAFFAIICIIYFSLFITVIAKGDSYNPTKSDVIIVLGYSLEDGDTPSEYLIERMETALRLYNEGYAKNIIVSGGRGPTDNIPVAVSMKKWFLDSGVPRDFIYSDTISNNTYENFVFSNEICNLNNFNSAIIVTNDFHMYRSMTIADEFFDDFSGEEAVLPFGFEKNKMLLKEPLSFIKYELLAKDTSQKILEKKKESLLLSQAPFDTTNKYNDILNNKETTSYDITLDYNSKDNTFKGVETITFYNKTNANIENIILNLYHNRFNNTYETNLNLKKYTDEGYINITSVKSDNNYLDFADNTSYVDIKIPPLPSSKSITFTVEFDAYMPNISSSSGVDQTTLWAKDFFPTVSEFKNDKFIYNLYYEQTEFSYANMSNYKINIITDNDLTVILPSTVSSKTENDKKITTMDKTLLRNLSFAISKESKNTSLTSSSNVNITMYHFSNSSNIYDLLYSLENGIFYINKTVGSYPYKDLKIVFTTMNSPMVSSSSGIIFVDSSYISNPNVKSELLNALSSQWFGLTILADPVLNSGLSNGLSNYLSALIYNNSKSEIEYFDTEYELLNQMYDNLAIKKINTPIYEFKDYDNYYNIENLKTKLMMYSLSVTLEDRWTEFLRDYYKTYSFKIIDEDNFTMSADEVTEIDLSTFFDNWLNKEELFYEHKEGV